MFVLKSKYTCLEDKYDELLSKYRQACRDRDQLALKVQEGVTLLRKAKALMREHELELNKAPMFSDYDIKTLITLCHPDKHNNSTLSKNVTSKLLELRKGKR